MENLTLNDHSQALFALGVVAVMFLLFLRESFPTEVVAIFGVPLDLSTSTEFVNNDVGFFAGARPISSSEINPNSH